MRQINQRGIAIGPILFIVAILAVLAAAIAAASGSFTGDISAIKVKAQATAILGYVNELQIGVDRVMSRCPDTEISLANSVDSGYAENPLAPADKSCHVFDVNGGGILFKEPPPDVDLTEVPEEIRHYFIHTRNQVRGFGKTCPTVGDNSCRDLVIILPGIKRELCLKINDMVDVNMESGDVVTGWRVMAQKESDYWSNTNDNGRSLYCGVSISTEWRKHNCCIKVTENDVDPRIPLDSYVFFHVLHVR